MMESIKCIFTSPSKEKIGNNFDVLPCIAADDYDESDKLSLKIVQPNGKTIVCNMESVINSVKQKRKKNKKKNKASTTIPESEIADISDILSNNLKFISPNVSLENNYEVEIKNDELLEKLHNECPNNIEIKNTPTKCIESKDAFTLMMDARNKSIGTNSMGKEISPDSKPFVLDTKNKTRKLQLEAWAVKKGALKRKELDIEHEECILQKMEDRKSRLKKLIKNDSDGENKAKGRFQKNKKKQMLKNIPLTDSEIPMTDKKSSTIRDINKKINILSESESLIIDEEKSSKSYKRKRNSKLSTDENNEVSISLPKRKIQRLLSTDSSETKNSKKIKEDKNIIETIASPIKKRESLLGYFNVVDKTSSENKENGTERNMTTNNKDSFVEKSSKASNNKNMEKSIEVDMAKREEKTCTTPTGRPKRLCTEKIKKYNIDTEISPKKSKTKAKKSNNRCCSPTVTPLKIINLQSPLALRVIKSPSVRRLSETIDLAYLSDSNDSVKKSKRIAPIFMKSNIIDPDILKARQNFLLSGIPEKLRIEIEKQKIYEESYELDLFPTISHITQLTEIDLSKIVSTDSVTKIKIKNGIADIPNVKNRKIFNKEIKKILEIPVTVISKNNQRKVRMLEMKDCKKFIKEQANVQINFPRVRCFKQLREKFLLTNVVHPNNINDSNVTNCLDKSIEIIEDSLSSINGNLLFCDKYKPNTINEFLVNSSPVHLLKNFLLSWKNEESTKETFYNSSDDFQNNSSSNLSCDIINYVVLIGPPGCGKTNSVYALANELNFKVLEINAGSKRSGKKILQELQEATQSHNVRTKDDKTNVFRKALNGKKIFHQKNGEDSDSNKKKSIILIDDADIIFDQDDGFVNAINQLVSTSKRPVILISNTDKCSHLTKYISHNSIRYFNANIDKISQWLSMLCLVEKMYIPSEEISLLYINNNCDARKTINELQFFLQSGGDRIETSSKAVTLNNRYFIESNKLNNVEEQSNDDCNDMSTDCNKVKNKNTINLYQHKLLLNVFPQTFDINNIKFNIPKILKFTMNFEAMDNNKINKLRKLKSPIKMKQNNMQQMALDNQINFYENLSRAFYLKKKLHEDDYLNYNLNDEIFKEVLQLTIKCEDDAATPMINFKNYNLSYWETKQNVTSCLHFNVPSKFNRNNINLDYEPCLRSICRSEQERRKSDRRGCRFYHYLRNMTTITSFNLKEFDKYCNHFNE